MTSSRSFGGLVKMWRS